MQLNDDETRLLTLLNRRSPYGEPTLRVLLRADQAQLEQTVASLRSKVGCRPGETVRAAAKRLGL
jgi:hypothetical protein